MTHYELFNDNKLHAPSPGVADANSSVQGNFAVNSDMHFPLHFSRVEKLGDANVPAAEAESTEHIPLISTPPPLDYRSVGGDGRDFLMPLLHPVSDPSPDMDSSSVSHASSISEEQRQHSVNQEFRPLVNLTVGDELSEPFAAAVPLLNYPTVLQSPASSVARAESANAEVVHSSVGTSSNHHGSLDKIHAEPVSMESETGAILSAGPSTEKCKEVYPDLNEEDLKLFDYFRDRQSILMSVSPLNYFRSVFLAFSLRYRVIMYGILAWAAWHQGTHEELARNYFEKASRLIRGETINSRSKEEILAALLVLASAKICSGDTTDWRPYLLLAGETIHLHGGLTSFMESESVRWLLKNFAYHEILASSSLNMPRLFSVNDFEMIFEQPSSATLPDTLCACCQSLFVVIERINELIRSVRLLFLSDGKNTPMRESGQNISSVLPQSMPDTSADDIERIYIAAHELEDRIWAAQPAHKILQYLSEHDLHLQLTLFEVFKLVAVLHMYQSVLRMNSASLSMQVVAHRLLKSIDELFGTMVEGILVFPLFILGMSASTASTRQFVRDRFSGMAERLCAKNITQALALVEKVWKGNNNGEKHIDWNDLVDFEGLHFCFA